MTKQSPFERLGIAPTLEVVAIKRAWFAALKNHPPHADPEGFRLLRGAYEALLDPAQRTTWYARASFDPSAELAAYEDLAQTVRVAPAAEVPLLAPRRAHFVKTLSVLRWSEACAMARLLRG